MGAKDYVLQSANILNVLLLSAASVLIAGGVYPLLETGKYAEPSLKKTTAVEIETRQSFVSPAVSDYLIISEQNIFHPERKVPSDSGEKNLPRPELVLYGTMVSDGFSAAYVEDKRSPYSTPGRGKRQKVLKKGDVVSGFVLDEITSDRIILSRGDDKMSVVITPGEKKRGNESAAAPSAVNVAKADTAAKPAEVKPAIPVMPPSSQQAKPRLPARPGVKRLPFHQQ
jgi:hypothetical protein